MQTFLEFEKPIQHLVEQIEKLKEVATEGEVDVKATLKDLTKKLAETRKNVYAGLSPWERVQVSRHPDRPYTLKYINELSEGTFVELHGDRTVKDDNRLMKLAEKFNKPIVTLIDTPGAFPGLEAEERGQGEAIARNLFEMMELRVPVICVIIGEGASGGALGIGIGDKVLMLENTWYSVISPESCSSILWRSWDFKEQAASALKLTAKDMLANKLIDGIIEEPVGGAHTDPDDAVRKVKAVLVKQLDLLVKVTPDKLVDRRIKKFCAMGVVLKAKR